MLPFYKAEIIALNGDTILSIDDCISVQAARSFNTDGSCTLVIPDYYERSLFRMHTRMRLWRHDYAGVPHNWGDTVWFLKKIDRARSEETYTLSFVDAFAMLKGRLVAYTSEGTYADKTLEEFQIDTYDARLHLDNMMRAYVRENLGLLALDQRRIMPGLLVEDDKNLGPYGEKQAAWQELGSVLSDLARMSSAKGVDLYYDLIPQEGGQFMFKVWTGLRGLDRGRSSPNPLLLTEESGLISDVHEIDDFTEVASYCYALGFDSGGSQVIRQAENTSLTTAEPFGRIEITANVNDADVDSVLDDAAIGALAGRRRKRQITAKIVENSSLSFETDVGYGDGLLVQVGTTEYECVLSTINVTWQEDEEQFDLQLLGEVFGEEQISAAPGLTSPTPTTNALPLVNAGTDQTIDFPDDANLAGAASDDGLPDPPGALTTTWSMTSGPGIVTFGDAALLTTTASFSMIGVYVLRLTASDGSFSPFDEMTVTVEGEPPPTNAAPVVDAGIDQTIGSLQAAILTGDVSDDNLPDPPNDVLTVWSKTSGPGTVFFGDVGEEATTATFSMIGVYVLRLTAFDGELTTFDEMTVTVEA